jgi:hypothetical protein
LDILEALHVPQAVVSHGGVLKDLAGTVRLNRQMVLRAAEVVLDDLESPRSRDEITAHVISTLALPENQTQYYLIAATVSAYLGYLCNEKRVRAQARHGMVRFARA